MATYDKYVLSGSTNGRPIKVALTTSPGTLVHTATSSTGTNAGDELYLYVNNVDTVVHTLTLEFGGTTNPDDRLILASIPAQSGIRCVIPGLPVNGGVVVRAFSDASNVLTLVGFANRVSP